MTYIMTGYLNQLMATCIWWREEMQALRKIFYLIYESDIVTALTININYNYYTRVSKVGLFYCATGRC